jgi:hypothetical protein
MFDSRNVKPQLVHLPNLRRPRNFHKRLSNIHFLSDPRLSRQQPLSSQLIFTLPAGLTPHVAQAAREIDANLISVRRRAFFIQHA